MGQYYRPTFISEEGDVETLDAHAFDNGLKLMEHSWIGNNFVNAALSLISESPKKVAWIGDYADEAYNDRMEHYSQVQSRDEFMVFYRIAWSEKRPSVKRSSFSKSDLAILGFDTKDAYLVNRSRGEYLDITRYIKECTTTDGEYDWCISPLPLLTACGNGRGGGDFHSQYIGYENVGLWAFDKLQFTNVCPDGLVEVLYRFSETEAQKGA